MTQPNQFKKSDDFKLVIVFRIEGQNSRAVILRIVGFTSAIVAACVKVATMLMAGPH